MKKKLIVFLLIIMLFNMVYIQPVYAQTSLIESIKQKASELALIKLAVATGVSAVTTYHTAKGFVNDMVSSAPDVFNDFKDSVVDSTNKLKFALVASDTVWQGTKAFINGLNKPINEPVEYIPSGVKSTVIVDGLGSIDYSYNLVSGTTYHFYFSLDGVTLVDQDIKLSLDSGTEIIMKFNDAPNSSFIELADKINKATSNFYFDVGPFRTGYIRQDGTEFYNKMQPTLRFYYDYETGYLTRGNYSKQVREVTVVNSYTLDGQVYNPDGTITLDPRSIDPEDDFLNDKTGDIPKRLVGFPLPWSELPSVSEGVINDGIDLGELSNAQLEAIDLTLQGLLEQVDTLTTDLVRTEDLLKEALVNPPIDTTGVIPAIESIGNIITNAFNPPTISLNLTPLMNISILTNKFPFSIPWDLKNSISLLLDSPDPPIFEIPFNFGGLMEGFTLDFTIFDPVIGLFRWLITIAFTIALIYFSTVFI